MSKYILFIFGFILCIIVLFATPRIAQKKNKRILEETMPQFLIDQEIIQQNIIEEPPERLLIDHLARSYALHRDPMILIEIGDLWYKGAYPRFKSDKTKAMRYYEISASSTDTDISTIATAKLRECGMYDLDVVDDVGEQLDSIYSLAARKTKLHDVPIEEEIDVDVDIQNLIHIAFDPDVVVPPIANQQHEQPPRIFLNDSQNVHDHYINKITKKNLDRIHDIVGDRYDTNSIQQYLIDLLAKDKEFTNEQRLVIVNALQSFSDKSKQYDYTELEVLSLVCEYIMRHQNKDILLHNLFLQLEDCYSNGFIVCTTGKISRVVSVVGDLEEFDNARNIYYIKDELETLASKIRNDHLSTLTKKQVDDYNRGGDESDAITEEMKKKYIEAVRAEYCNKLGIDYEIISPHVETNLFAF